MPACRQCGKENPEGTAFCGYCAAPLSTKPKPAVESAPPPPAQPIHQTLREVKVSPQKTLKPEVRIQPSPPPPAQSTAGKGVEWIPWSELSGGQRAGRVLAAFVVLFLVFTFTRGILRGLSAGGSGATAPTAEVSDVPMTDGDRRDGIESLCKVFQIYGVPKTDKDAEDSVKNAAELFKLGGNQSPERSVFILKAIARQFRAGTLGAPDCTQVGAAIGATDNPNAPDGGPTR